MQRSQLYASGHKDPCIISRNRLSGLPQPLSNDIPRTINSPPRQAKWTSFYDSWNINDIRPDFRNTLLGNALFGQRNGLDASILVELQILHTDMAAAVATRFPVLHVRTIVVKEVPLTLELIDRGMYREAELRRAGEQSAVCLRPFDGRRGGIGNLFRLNSRCVCGIHVIIQALALEKPRPFRIVAQRHLADFAVQLNHVLFQAHHVAVAVAPCHPGGAIVINKDSRVYIRIRTVGVRRHVISYQRSTVFAGGLERAKGRIAHRHGLSLGNGQREASSPSPSQSKRISS